MIVVDSSVWVSHFANVMHDEVVRLRTIERAYDIIVGDLILMEVLRGARSEQAASAIEARLALFDIRPMTTPRIAVAAAQNYRLLRNRGITIRSSIDLVIGTFCIENGHHLLQRDRDYAPMHQHLGLMLC